MSWGIVIEPTVGPDELLITELACPGDVFGFVDDIRAVIGALFDDDAVDDVLR